MWAQYNLGLMYAKGKGTQKDGQQAIHWFTKSAEQGNPRAQFSLGMIFDNGEGVPKDHGKALKWYTKAAEQGHTWAKRYLGGMYLNGKGTPQDYKKAYMWFNLAFDNKAKDTIKMKLSPKDLIEAIEMTKRCRDSGYKNC